MTTTRELLTEIARRMKLTQNSIKGRDLGRLCEEAIANLAPGVLDYEASPNDSIVARTHADLHAALERGYEIDHDECAHSDRGEECDGIGDEHACSLGSVRWYLKRAESVTGVGRACNQCGGHGHIHTSPGDPSFAAVGCPGCGGTGLRLESGDSKPASSTSDTQTEGT